MADYSTAPLAKKLGIRGGMNLLLIDPPYSFPSALGDLPEDVTILAEPRGALDLVLLFAEWRGDLVMRFPSLAERLAPAGMLWVAWPKKASGRPTDLNFDVVQKIGLATGLVDTKICAIDGTWSGLKFVMRLKDRK